MSEGRRAYLSEIGKRRWERYSDAVKAEHAAKSRAGWARNHLQEAAAGDRVRARIASGEIATELCACGNDGKPRIDLERERVTAWRCAECWKLAHGPSDGEISWFVAESNLIEGEPDVPGVPVFDDHLAAAMAAFEAALTGKVQDPIEIHASIMRANRSAMPGQYREIYVMVGGSVKASPLDVPDLMYGLLEEAHRRRADGLSRDDVWWLHNEFESIHPFLDGNGRTGRVWLNALLLASGYRLWVVRNATKESYYARITEHEAQQLAGRQAARLQLAARARR